MTDCKKNASTHQHIHFIQSTKFTSLFFQHLHKLSIQHFSSFSHFNLFSQSNPSTIPTNPIIFSFSNIFFHKIFNPNWVSTRNQFVQSEQTQNVNVSNSKATRKRHIFKETHSKSLSGLEHNQKDNYRMLKPPTRTHGNDKSGEPPKVICVSKVAQTGTAASLTDDTCCMSAKMLDSMVGSDIPAVFYLFLR